MPDEDTQIEEGGLEPAAEPDEAGDVAVEDAPPPTFTPEDDAQDLGARYQQFAAQHDDPRVARREYGRHVDQVQSALGRIHRGIDPTDEDLASLEALGYEMPEPVEEEPEAVEPLWGAPWAEPTTMDEFYALANARPDQAMAFIDANPGKVNDETRQQVLAYWAENDRAAAISYEREQARQQAITEAQAYADEQIRALREELAPVHQRNAEADQANRVTNAKLMVQEARAGIPDFADHEDGVIKLIEEGMQQYGASYFENILQATPEARLQYLSDLTGAAAWRSRPAAQAEAEAQQKAAEAAKVGAGSERGRGAASTPGGNAPSAMKKKFTEDIKAALNSPV